MLHIDIPSQTGITRLASVRANGCVAIYLTTGTLPEEAERARIQLANLRDDAVEQLRASDIDRVDIQEFTAAIDDLIDDTPYWSYQSETLAIFATQDHVETFRLPSKLPEQINVSDRFLVKPLVRALTFPHAAFILALSQNEIRIVELSAEAGAYRVEVPDLPLNAAHHAGKSSINGRSASGRLQGSEGQKVRLRQYSRAVENAIRPMLNGLEVPLILATTQPLDGIYRSLSSYPYLADESITGNPEELSDGDLAALARPILDSIYAEQLAVIKDDFEALRGRGEAVTDLSDVARAATFAAIDTLLFDLDSSIPGLLDEAGAIEFHDAADANNYGVIDEIVRRALATGATVIAVRSSDLIGEGAVVASLRFSV